MRHAHECAIAALPFLKTPYNFDRDLASAEFGQANTEPTRTQQQFKEECDINTIVERFGLTGELPENVRVPVDGDFTGVTDYQTALNLILEAEASFMEFPANVRERFHNDPGELVSFVSDPANLEEARKLGIARPAPTPPAPTLVSVVGPIPGLGDPSSPSPSPGSKPGSAQ